MGQLMVDIINTAENFVTNFSDKMHLDFSIKSLDEIDDFLDEMCNYDLDEDSIYNIYTMVGSYVFEVARRQYGGRYYWLNEEQQPILVEGEPDFTVSIKAWDKVKKYLKNGSEDNIAFWVQGYKEHIDKGRQIKGYRALII